MRYYNWCYIIIYVVEITHQPNYTFNSPILKDFLRIGLADLFDSSFGVSQQGLFLSESADAE